MRESEYTSQLKGWAIDRVIELAKASDSKPTVETVLEEAKKLVEYAYTPKGDIEQGLLELRGMLDRLADEYHELKVKQAMEGNA